MRSQLCCVTRIRLLIQTVRSCQGNSTEKASCFPELLFILFSLVPTVALACSFEAQAPPALLQVQLATAIPTPTSTPPIGASPTPPLPRGALSGLQGITSPQIRTMLDAVQSDSLMVTVGTLADFQTRHVLSSTTDPDRGIGAARTWLLAQFNAIRDANPGQAISVWTQVVPFTWQKVNLSPENVIAIFQGTDVGAGVIVVGAHYDSITTNFTDGNAYAPGADDNASGVAALLEIARILAPQPHRATIIFVAFAAEETGRQGSLAFVQSYLQAQNPPIDVKGMINLDIVGSEVGPNGEIDHRTIRMFSAEPNDSTSRQFARQVALIASTYLSDVNIVLQSAEERAGRWGDHQSFSAAGYPSIRLIQGLEDLARQHSPRDTIDNVQSGYLMRVTRAALVAVSILADGPLPPSDMALRLSATPSSQAETLVWTPEASAVRYVVALRKDSSLFFDKIFTVGPDAQMTWEGFSGYEAVAIGAIDGSGRIGPLSPEVAIPALKRH